MGGRAEVLERCVHRLMHRLAGLGVQGGHDHMHRRLQQHNRVGFLAPGDGEAAARRLLAIGRIGVGAAGQKL